MAHKIELTQDPGQARLQSTVDKPGNFGSELAMRMCWHNELENSYWEDTSAKNRPSLRKWKS